MGFHLRRHESVQAAVRRIAIEELEASIRDVRLRQPDSHEAVHDFRKRCKKLRGLLRLVRPQLGDQFRIENVIFRDLSRELSFVRDAQALLEAIDRLLTHYASELTASDVPDLRAHLIAARDRVAGGEEQLVAQLEGMIHPLHQAIDRVVSWELPDLGFETIAPGIGKTYQRARRAMQLAYQNPTPEAFHEWRKRVKYHWHHSLLLRRICPRLLKAHRRLAEQLGEMLGQDHDYAVLRERLAADEGGEAFQQERQLIFDLIEKRQVELRFEMARLGHYLQAETTPHLLERWRVYWQTWRDETSR